MSIEKNDLPKIKPNALDLLRVYRNPSPFDIYYIEDPSEEVQFAAVRENIASFLLIENPSEKVQLYAVTVRPFYIRYIKNPSDKVQLKSFISSRCNTDLLKFIDNQCIALRVNCISRYPMSIRYIKNPSGAIKMLAVKNDGLAIKYIENPSEEIKFAALRENGEALQYIKNPTPKMKRVALKNTGAAIKFIDNPSYSLLKSVLRKDGALLSIVKDNPLIDETLSLIAVKSDYSAILSIKNPTDEMQIIAVESNSDSINYITNPCKKAQVIAVEKNPENILKIKDPCDEAIAVAAKSRLISWDLVSKAIHNTQSYDIIHHQIKLCNSLATSYYEKHKELFIKMILAYPEIIKELHFLPDHIIISVLEKDYTLLEHIKNPSEEMVNTVILIMEADQYCDQKY